MAVTERVFHRPGLAIKQHSGLAGKAQHGALQMLQLFAYGTEAGAVQPQPVIRQLAVEPVLGVAAGGSEDVQAGPAVIVLATVGAGVGMLEIGQAEAPLRGDDDRHRPQPLQRIGQQPAEVADAPAVTR
ncbi:hypothetical protein G6F31_019497 [Rhizopus arrhizus]|nr:hypothetical protein G6F31_019497 [Rhizopus arrhizus]